MEVLSDIGCGMKAGKREASISTTEWQSIAPDIMILHHSWPRMVISSGLRTIRDMG